MRRKRSPSVRARPDETGEGQANVLWTMGRREEAARHLHDMLRLNPSDNQKMRHVLAGYLLFLDRDKDLTQLLAQYPDDDSAAWAYARALLAFRLEGDTIPSRRLLKKAKKANKHVPALLWDPQSPSAEQPDYSIPGDKDEALLISSRYRVGWKSTLGAIAWVRAQQKIPKKKKCQQSRGPLDGNKSWLTGRLPQEEDIWQADYRLLPLWIKKNKEAVRPWVILVTSQTHDRVLAHEVLHEMPEASFLWDILERAMRHPSAGEPHRPTSLQVRPHKHWQSLKPHLEEIGVAPSELEHLDQIESLLAGLAKNVGGERQTGLLDVPGVTPAQVRSFYDAAAEFFLQMPWKKVGDKAVVKVACARFHDGPWDAVLMGQSGVNMGLALYEDGALLKKMPGAAISDEESSRLAASLGVVFGEESEIPLPDLEAARKFSWRVARPDAYPEVIHKDRGQSLRGTRAWELELMEACLRSIPEFANRRRQDDTNPVTMTVALASGEVRLELAWVLEDE